MIALAKKSIRAFLRVMHRVSAELDRSYLNQEISRTYPPVFILGAPRSGTTLLYQLLMSAFTFSYIPNISNTFYMCPITAVRFGRRWCKNYQSSFTSTFGHEHGCMAPSEAGNIWNRWFPYEKREGYNYTPKDFLSNASRQDIYRFVAHVENMFRAPFLTKNVKMSVRIPALHEIFPDALYIHIQRDPVQAATSLLRIRRKLNKSWWSVLPKDYQKIINKPDAEQVCYQVYYTENDIAEDLTLIDSSRIFKLQYEQLCQTPVEHLDGIYQFFGKNNCITDYQPHLVPSEFNASTSSQERLNDHDLITIQQTIKKLFREKEFGG